MKKLETEIVFLDTSAIQQSNFTHGRKMREMADFARNGFISIKITSVVYYETKARIIKEVKKVRDAINNVKPNNTWAVLRNLERFQLLFEMTNFNVKEVSDGIIDVFEAFIQQNEVEIINSDIASVEEVFARYFNDQYPFQEGNKKNEFPDGFILNTIEKWCEKNGKKAFLLSGDDGILRCESDTVIPIGNIAILLDKINRVATHRKMLEEIELIYAANYDNILSDILTDIQQPLEEHLERSFSSVSFDVDEVELSSIDSAYIDDYSITHVDENDAQIEVRGRVLIEYSVSYADRRFAFYDKEDDTWYGEEYETKHGRETVPFKAGIKISHNPIAGKEFADYSGVESFYFDRPVEF